MDSVYEGEKRMSKMTLDDAIIHAKELSESQSVCEDCREEHKQLAEWLEELKRNKDKECEISAREMFEELGYEFEKEYTSDGVNDTYRYNKCSMPDSIIFDLNGKNIIINKIFHTISFNELQAIIQQCKELGWNKE